MEDYACDYKENERVLLLKKKYKEKNKRKEGEEEWATASFAETPYMKCMKFVLSV